MRYTTHPARALPRHLAVVGQGRVGRTIAAALSGAPLNVLGPYGRGELPPRCDCLLLCVPDREIEAVARVVAGVAPLVGHTSGATPLAALSPPAESGAGVFSLHPLMSFPEPIDDRAAARAHLAGAGCAIAGDSARTRDVAAALASATGMVPFEIDEVGRAAYHAAASIASNFLVTLEAAAEQVASGAGLSAEQARALFAPLVARTVENWARKGPARALTGPIARGDEATVARQRAAVAATAPALVDLFDVLVEHTRALAAQRPSAPAPAAEVA